MAQNHDEHGEHDGPIHQAPWVFWFTVGICMAFGIFVLMLNSQPDRPWAGLF